METTVIEIDFDTHKLIEAERRGFSEKPLFALRRLLGLPDVDDMLPASPVAATGHDWREDGVVLPHGTKARMEYARGSQRFEGVFLDGELVVQGRRFDSLSAAASALARTKDGLPPRLNGWNYWEVKKPGSDRWELMSHLRSRARGKAVL